MEAPIPPTVRGRALNPKGLLIFLSLLPQFADPGRRWPVAVQLVALGVVFVATCTVFYLVLGALAARLAAVRPATARFLDVVSGAGMIVVGVLLLVGNVVT